MDVPDLSASVDTQRLDHHSVRLSRALLLKNSEYQASDPLKEGGWQSGRKFRLVAAPTECLASFCAGVTMSRTNLLFPQETIAPFDLEAFVTEATNLNQRALESFMRPFLKLPTDSCLATNPVLVPSRGRAVAPLD
jgi:hypothetical protein